MPRALVDPLPGGYPALYTTLLRLRCSRPHYPTHYRWTLDAFPILTAVGLVRGPGSGRLTYHLRLDCSCVTPVTVLLRLDSPRYYDCGLRFPDERLALR